MNIEMDICNHAIRIYNLLRLSSSNYRLICCGEPTVSVWIFSTYRIVLCVG